MSGCPDSSGSTRRKRECKWTQTTINTLHHIKRLATSPPLLSHLTTWFIIVELAFQHITIGVRKSAMAIPQTIPPVAKVDTPFRVSFPPRTIGEEVMDLTRVHRPIIPHDLAKPQIIILEIAFILDILPTTTAV